MEKGRNSTDFETSIEAYEAIENYLFKKMSQQERAAFEMRLEHNPALREEVKRHREVQDTLIDGDVLDFRRKLQRISKSSRSTATQQKKYWYYGIAASLLVLLGITLFLGINNTPTSEELFQKYYAPFPVNTLRSGTNSKETQEALKAYQQQDYELAIEKIQKQLQHNPNCTVLPIYLGSAYLSLDRLEEALNALKRIEQGDSNWEEAQWYAALTFLKMDNIDKLQHLLKEIISYDGIYKEEAIQLLTDIKSTLKQ